MPAGHPFWVEGKGWTAVQDLAPGERLRGHDGQLWPVEAVTATTDLATVYNCRIADYHTYFVQAPGGPAWLWAHNACDWKNYENGIVGMLGRPLVQAARTFYNMIGGRRIADYILHGGRGLVAVEAKFIRNWTNSLYNPASTWGGSWLGDKVRQFFVGQVKDYLGYFTHLHIVSNNVEFIKHAKAMLLAAGVDLRRITFLLVA